MNDKTFEISLTSLAAAAVVWMVLGIAAAVTGMPWLSVDLPFLIFLTILIGLVVLIVGGGILLYFWGKNYMARG